MMAIKIKKHESGFTAEVTPPHCNQSHWKSETPLPIDELIEKLLQLGCHQTDIGDAICEVDPGLIGLEN